VTGAKSEAVSSPPPLGRWSVGDLPDYLEGAAADTDAGPARKPRTVQAPLPDAGRADAAGPEQRQRQGNACRGGGLRGVLRHKISGTLHEKS
jgi:hypothetical protein